jgi:YNFM family putative membrane transporter
LIHHKTPQYYQTVLALALGSAAIFANLYCLQPLLPTLANDFGKGLLDITLVFTIATFAMAGSLIFYGALSDAIGRYWLMLLSLGGTSLVTLAMVWAEGFEQLLFLRLLQGVVLGALPAVAIAYIGDEFSPHLVPGVVGIYIAANTLGGIGGRLLGGFIAESYSWNDLYIVMTGLNALALLALYRWLTQPKNFVSQPLKVAGVLRDIWHHMSHFELITIYVVIGLAFGVFINLYSYLAFILVEPPFNAGSSFIGLLFVTYLAGTFASASSGWIAHRIGQLNTIVFGILVFMLGVLFLFSADIRVTILGLTINAFGFFLAHSVSSSWVNGHAKKAKASASAGYLVFYYLGASMGPLMLYPFWHTGGWSRTLIGAELYLSLSLGLLVWLMLRLRKAKAAAVTLA